jgi:multiple sugar transport system permease protein
MTTHTVATRTTRAPVVRRRPPGGRATPYVYLAPFLVLYAAAVLGPLLYALYTSLFTSRLVGGTVFTGLANYARAFTSGEFWSGVRRVVLFGVIEVPVMLLLAIFFAMLLDLGITRLSGFFRLVYFLPYAVPGVVGTIMWGFILEPQFGPFTAIAQALGTSAPAFLGPHAILPTIGFITIWQTTGFNVIILFTALRSVPQELTEAAVVDGATLTRIMVQIKLPMVRGAITLSVFLGIIGTLQLFTEPYILSGFTSSISTDYTPNMNIYSSAFGAQDFDYAAAISFLLGIVTVAAAVVALWIRNRRRGAARAVEVVS